MISFEKIGELARAHGFHQAGITRVADLAEGEQAVRDWTAAGFHGGMKYLEEFDARRRKFFEDIPDAAGVIVLGMNYYDFAAGGKPAPALAGKIARYAWGRDYHEIIRERHAAFIEDLKKHAGPEFKAKSCVDIQPVPEKFAARQSGFGFIGKNSLVLSKEFGPWIFLSEIVTNLDLPASGPAQGNCGTCSKCQTACPTGALDRDYTIDARLCIAYLTIEHKGIIPRELRPKIKDWVFGCDICLDSCPFDSKAKQTDRLELTAKSGFGPALDLETLFTFQSNAAYEKAFAGTALLRASRKQLIRNACVVLGNSGRREALPFLAKGLEDPSWLVRLHAAWALSRFPGGETEALLRTRSMRESEPQVLEEIRWALSRLLPSR